jgi:very-short-patch-repair endonuclease
MGLSEIFTCAVCGKQMKGFINPAHLRTHNMTCDDYRKLDPNAKFTLATAWNKGLTKETSESMRKSSESHRTPEYLEKYRKTMIERYGSYSTPGKRAAIQKANGGRNWSEIVKKRERTMIEKYGVPNFSMLPESKPVLSKGGKKGISKFRRRFDRTGYRTEYEQMFHQMHPTFRCNEKILTGVRPGIEGEAAWYSPDFIDDDTMTIYEIDGSFHFTDHDRKKDEFYKSLGYKVVRYTNEQVEKMYYEWLRKDGDAM